ncbi:hypothetical protein [Marinobacterium rhizophilum]|uniref:hypothetical protein n=1 Tax=Marinobacterium rhizophilum TaxID=420402 RepID=UPI0003A24042|nr:hypothetical protein [Marinobacterium rhizophilum]
MAAPRPSRITDRSASTGLRTCEARMLRVREQDRKLSMDERPNEVNMPRSGVEVAALRKVVGSLATR